MTQEILSYHSEKAEPWSQGDMPRVSVRQPILIPGYSLFLVIGNDLYIVHIVICYPIAYFLSLMCTVLESVFQNVPHEVLVA